MTAILGSMSTNNIFLKEQRKIDYLYFSLDSNPVEIVN